MIPFAANVTAKAEVKIANAFEWLGQPPKLPLPLGLSHPAQGGASHGQITAIRVLPSDLVCGSLPDELRLPDITLITFSNKLKTLLLNM